MPHHSGTQATGYFFTQPGAPLEKRVFEIPPPSPDSVVIEVAGCGLCHTDISFLTLTVKTRASLPLVLGHEISGTVAAAGQLFESWKGKAVIVPAVLPCGECELCRAGRDNVCPSQKMPGNDFNGGFASHLSVPGRFLCELPAGLDRGQLAELSVVADAVTTPYQSLKRSQTRAGDVAIVVGVGGIGLYLVQHARNAGAHVVALDIDEGRLETARRQGAEHAICVKGLDEKEIRDQVRSFVQSRNYPRHQWRVFETSGTSAGQATAYSLLTTAGTLGIVGFTMDKVNVRLSNIMAFDADVFGNWGCRPSYYPEVVRQVLAKQVSVAENVRRYPLDKINEVIELALEHKLTERAVLVPGESRRSQ